MTSPPGQRGITLTGGSFGRLHREMIGPLPDLASLDPETIRPELLVIARTTWKERARSEFRSIQIMTRFLTEVVGAGDPLDAYAGALGLVEDEIRHTEMCVAVCARLGAQAVLPDPVTLDDPPEFLRAPMAERALATAMTMLGINETISVGFVSDLAARCQQPAIKAVLEATLDDEETHGDFGWSYIRAALARFPAGSLPHWRHLVKATLEPHQRFAARALAEVPSGLRGLAAWPDAALVDLGLLSAQRQALVFERTWSEVLAPRLRGLDLLD